MVQNSLTPISAAIPINQTNEAPGFQTITQMSSGRATAAVASLVRSTQSFALGLLPGTTEAALAVHTASPASGNLSSMLDVTSTKVRTTPPALSAGSQRRAARRI